VSECHDLKEADIPADLLPKVRAWWVKRMQEAERTHGAEWPKHREWLADYMNAEVRDRLRTRR
jgi:hypothetical protein